MRHPCSALVVVLLAALAGLVVAAGAAEGESADWWLQQAEQEARRIEDQIARSSALEMIAITRYAHGGTNAARRAIAALDEKSRAMAYASLAQVQAQAGDVAGARETAASIADARQRETAYLSIAVRQIVGGDMDGAKGTARSIPDNSMWRERMDELILVAEAANQRPDVARTLVQRGGIAEQDPHHIQLLFTLMTLRQGVQSAVAVAGEIADPRLRAEGFFAIASVKKNVVEKDIRRLLAAAKEAILQTDNSLERGSILINIAAEEAEAGDVEAAQRTLALAEGAVAEDEFGFLRELMERARTGVMIRSGQIKLAMESEAGRGSGAMLVAAHLASGGRWDELRRWVASLPSAQRRAEAYLAATDVLMPKPKGPSTRGATGR